VLRLLYKMERVQRLESVAAARGAERI